MLSRVGANSSKTLSIQCISRRNFFDYLEVANRVDKGESLEVQAKSNQAALESDSSKFNWSFIKWYEANGNESLPVINSIKSKFNEYEQYIGSQGASGGSKIDFSLYRERIADPSFVDELEIQYNVDVATTKSIENMKTLENWKSESVDKFQSDCQESGDLLWAPMSKSDRDEWDGYVEKADELAIKTQEMISEMQKDYEQIDAERMVYGQETLQMKYNEHPQWAENIEDMVASRQSYADFVMFPFANNHVKYERLATMQDENRRKLFLEKFEQGSKLLNGLELPALGSGGGGH